MSEDWSEEDMVAEVGVESVVDMANRWMFGDVAVTECTLWFRFPQYVGGGAHVGFLVTGMTSDLRSEGCKWASSGSRLWHH